MLAIASLAFIGVTSAALGILWDSPKKGVSLKLGANQLELQHEPQAAADVDLKPAILDPSTTSTSGYPSSIPTQDLVIKDPPRSIDQTPPTTKPALKESDADEDTRKRHHLRANRRRHRRPTSSFAAIGRALGFRIAQWLDELEDR